MTTNVELEEAAKKLKLKNFRGVFMRDTLPSKQLKSECGIINLDSVRNKGTHWCGWYKNNSDKYYFDSFGLPPPTEMIRYLKSPIEYSTYQIQQFSDSNCGEWCLYMLSRLNRGENYKDIVLDIINSKTF